MTPDEVLLRAAEQCRQLALRVRTEAARQELIRLAENFEAKAKLSTGVEPARRLAAD